MNTLLTKPIDIIEKKEYKDILYNISGLISDFVQPLSETQIKLILNDIEYPTDYAKSKQIKTELVTRYYSIVDTYYNIRKKEIEIKIIDNQISNESNILKQQLLELEQEKLILSIQSENSRLNAVLKEIEMYYKYYIQYNGIVILTDEQKNKLEEELWKQKAINNPLIFEERYGDYLKSVLSDTSYKKYVTKRKKKNGLLARELINSM